MGLYDEEIIKNLKLKKNNKFIIIGVAVLILIIAITVLITIKPININKSNNISVKFSKNPFNILKDQNLKMLITVKNNNKVDVENTTLAVYPVEEIFYVSCEGSETGNNKITIPIFAKNATRTINCELKLNPNINKEDVLSGSYSFDIIYNLNEIEHEKRTMINIKKG